MNKSTHLSPLLVPLLCSTLAVLLAPPARGAVVTSVGTTGTFDAVGTNDIDLDPTGQLSTFKTSVTTAYNNNQGGVINWSTNMPALDPSSTTPGNTLTAIDVAYGASAAEGLTITFDRTMGLYINNVSNQVSGLSDTNAIIPDGGNIAAARLFNMTFSGADVVEIGAGMLARSTFATGNVTGVNFRATATFSDTTTSVINYTLTAGSTDTFLHFMAPNGETITSFGVTWLSETGGTLLDGQRRPVMDDFGFVVIPEPSAALLSLAGLGLLFRRRR